MYEFIQSLFTPSQGLFMAGSLITLIAIQIDDKRKNLIALVAQSLLIGTGFFLLGIMSPVLNSTFSIAVIITVYFFEKQGRELPKALAFSGVGIMMILNFWAMFNVPSLLAGGGLHLAATASIWDLAFFLTPFIFINLVTSKNTAHLRYFSFAMRMVLMTYNFAVGAYALEILGVPQAISNAIAIIRYDIKPRWEARRNKSEVLAEG
jgi:hypothetical protein